MTVCRSRRKQLLLDVAGAVGFTEQMHFSDIHVKCQLIDLIDMEEHSKHMARQRHVGANGNRTG